MNTILRAHVILMECRVILGELIRKVISPKMTIDVEFPLEFTII